MHVSEDILLPTVSKDATVRDAAKEMKRTNSGALLIRERNSVIGIVTDRDLVLRVLADDKASPDACINDISTKDMIACKSTDSVEKAAEIMEERQVRYLLVLNPNGAATGLLSLEMLAAKLEGSDMVGDVVASGHRNTRKSGVPYGETAPLSEPLVQ